MFSTISVTLPDFAVETWGMLIGAIIFGLALLRIVLPHVIRLMVVTVQSIIVNPSGGGLYIGFIILTTSGYFAIINSNTPTHAIVGSTVLALFFIFTASVMLVDLTKGNR